MELISIGQVSKMFNVSTRTLRYYEEIELISSVRQENYAYRTYDNLALLRIRQIIILRKLKIPLKEIGDILKNEDVVLTLKIFEKNVQEIESQIIGLSTIKSIMDTFIERLNKSVHFNLKLDLLGDETILKIVDTLNVMKRNLKEEKSMEDLNKANERIKVLKDVRIIYLPPATVVASHYIGDEPEAYVNKLIDNFVKSSGLCKLKPDLRHYGFNNPDPVDESGYHGYEVWVTIPDDMEVPDELEKKQFKGGLYAAHMIPFGAFEEWNFLNEWVENSDIYENDCNYEDRKSGFGCLEEHINYINHVYLPNTEPEGMQLDLLLPIREK